MEENNNAGTGNGELENFRMYYQLQFDRIDKLETRRETFCNFIIAFSGVLYAVIFAGNSPQLASNILYLKFAVVLVNVAAAIFISQTRPFIKMHQKRASLALAAYAPNLKAINDAVPKKDNDKDYVSRSWIYFWLHFLVISVTLLSMLNWPCLLNPS